MPDHNTTAHVTSITKDKNSVGSTITNRSLKG